MRSSKSLRCTFSLLQHRRHLGLPVTQQRAGSSLLRSVRNGCGNLSTRGALNSSRHFHSTARALSAKRSPYDVLGVSRDANKDEVKKKFKELAKKYHPDVCKDADAKEKFAELNNAYQILLDDNKRQMYDMTGNMDAAEQGGFDPYQHTSSREAQEDAFRQFFGAGGPFGGPFSSVFGEDPFSFHGRSGGSRNMAMQGEHNRRSISITLREAVFGTKREIKVNKATNCTTCDGKRTNPNTKPRKCHVCNGTGHTVIRQGLFIMETLCQGCGGAGKIADPCTACSGHGYTRELKTFEVSIPEGSDAGQVLKLRGLGEPGTNGGPAGDLYLDIVVEKDSQFRRKGQNLETDTEVPFTTAILGGDVNIQSIGGENLTARVPAGMQHNDTIVLKGKGVKSKSQFGDLVVYVKVKIPKTITAEQKNLIEEFAKTDNESNYKVDGKNSFWKLFKKQ